MGSFGVMLAFGRHWELNTLPEWNEQYLRFSEFEKLATEGGMTPEKFFSALTTELVRVETFRKSKESSLQKTQQSIESLSPKYMKGKSRAHMAKHIVQQVTQDISKMVVIYDSWNKLKSFSVLNRQGFEELVKTYNMSAKVDPAHSTAFEKRLDSSVLASLKIIDDAQNELEKKGLKVVSSGVRRPTKLQQAIVESSRQYDMYLEKNLILPLVKRDLAFKHQSMAADSFQFLRATFFRFIQLWPVLLPGLSAAPHVLAIGDLHVENYGTWRDAEGRWVWGVNDFDEAFPMAYTIDLVRLSVSIMYYHTQMKMAMSAEKHIERVLNGYADSLAKGGEPIILNEHPIMLRLAQNTSKDAIKYWKKLASLQQTHEPVLTSEVREMLLSFLPPDSKPMLIAHRVAGLGSLGRPRFVVLARNKGGYIARECKPAVPSGCYFAASHPGPYVIRQNDIIEASVRCHDPCFHYKDGWLIRRLSPEAGRIAIDKLSQEEESELFYRMGWELGNVHLGSPHAIDNVRRDLAERPAGWLAKAAAMVKQVSDEEHKTWKAHWETTLAAKEMPDASKVKQDDDHAEQVLGKADIQHHDGKEKDLPNPIRANL